MTVLAAAILTMCAAQLLDLVTFMHMVDVAGPSSERNPLVTILFESYGLPMVAVAKVALLAIVTAVVAVVLHGRQPRPRMAAAVVATGILVGIIGGISNAAVVGVL
jgi:hypothetical protein